MIEIKFKYLLAVLVASILPAITSAQKSRVIELSFDSSNYYYRELNGKVTIVSTTENSCYGTDYSAPAIPIENFCVLMGENEVVDDYKIEYEEKLFAENIDMDFNPRLTLNAKATESISHHTNISFPLSDYPTNILEYRDNMLYKGYRFVSCSIYPFRYNVDERKLYFKNKIRITLYTKTDNNLKKQKVYRDENTVSFISKLMINADELDVLYPVAETPVNNMDRVSYSVNVPFEYIIITSDSLKQTFQKLANWKTVKGVRSKVITVEAIDSLYTGSNMPVKIKNAIKDYYDNQNGALEYVLLGGDIEIVPSLMSKLEAVNDSILYLSSTPADIFYATLDDMDWDKNRNGVYGELADSVNLMSDIAVSRVSVSNSCQALDYINRVIRYEKNAKEYWRGKLLIAGCKLKGNVLENGQLISDAQYFGKKIFKTFSNHFSGQVFHFFDTMTDHQDGANYNVTQDHLQYELSSGYDLFHMIAHGDQYSWQMENISDSYDNGYASAFANNGYTFITTSSCLTNAFDLQDSICLSETFMRNTNGNILTYWGCSRESWYSPSYGTIDLLMQNYYDNRSSSFHLKYAQGIEEAKNLYYANNNGERDRWNIITSNALGDPELTVYLHSPFVFNLSDMVFSNNQLHLYSIESHSRICVTSKNDYGNSYFYLIPQTQSGNEEIVSIPGRCRVAISHAEYEPAVFSIYPTDYLQNETFSENTWVFSNSLQIGSNVTNMEENGPVIVEDGSLSIHCNGDVLIKNDLEVKKGVTLEITTNN